MCRVNTVSLYMQSKNYPAEKNKRADHNSLATIDRWDRLLLRAAVSAGMPRLSEWQYLTGGVTMTKPYKRLLLLPVIVPGDGSTNCDNNGGSWQRTKWLPTPTRMTTDKNADNQTRTPAIVPRVPHIERSAGNEIEKQPGPVFSNKLRYIVGFGLVKMAISTNPTPTIYCNLYWPGCFSYSRKSYDIA